MSSREMISERHGRLFLSSFLFQIGWRNLQFAVSARTRQTQEKKYYIGSSIYSIKYNMPHYIPDRPKKRKKKERQSRKPHSFSLPTEWRSFFNFPYYFFILSLRLSLIWYTTLIASILYLSHFHWVATGCFIFFVFTISSLTPFK
jgi:hypothetical protein